MPLNYSKWDQLELSDDSDIEGHPNVDKKSLIRWKQRDIHEKREQRNFRITSLGAEIDCNIILLAHLKSFLTDLSSTNASIPPPKRFSNEVERLRTNPSPEAPPTEAQQPVPYDTMILKLLETVANEAREATGDNGKDEEKLGNALIERLNWHINTLGNVISERKTELEELEKEKKKHITSEDMHEGWESKYVPAKPEPAPITKPKNKTKTTKTSIEVLNPSSSSSSTPSAPVSTAPSTDDLDEELPEMTPSLTAFAKLPLWAFEKSWEFIQSHRDVVVPGASDALLVAAFTAQTDGNSTFSKQCVHQSLSLQYGDKLGKDGLKLFYQRMIAGGPKVHTIFRKDVEDTYAHIVTRVAATAHETSQIPASGAEQIQLVAENPNTEISFNVPDGPPPEHLTLEGPGTEDMDINEVRRVLQMRWDMFSGLSEEMKEALKKGELEGVNKVLGDMPVPEAEKVVELLDLAGILSFAEGGIRDETGKEDAVEDATEDAT